MKVLIIRRSSHGETEHNYRVIKKNEQDKTVEALLIKFMANQYPGKKYIINDCSISSHISVFDDEKNFYCWLTFEEHEVIEL